MCICFYKPLTFPSVVCISATGNRLYSHLEEQIQALHVTLQKELDYRKEHTALKVLFKLDLSPVNFFIFEQYFKYILLLFILNICGRLNSVKVWSYDSFGWSFSCSTAFLSCIKKFIQVHVPEQKAVHGKFIIYRNSGNFCVTFIFTRFKRPLIFAVELVQIKFCSF